MGVPGMGVPGMGIPGWDVEVVFLSRGLLVTVEAL